MVTSFNIMAMPLCFYGRNKETDSRFPLMNVIFYQGCCVGPQDLQLRVPIKVETE